MNNSKKLSKKFNFNPQVITFTPSNKAVVTVNTSDYYEHTLE